WIAAQRSRDGDVRRGVADDQHPPQDAREPAPPIGVTEPLNHRVVIVTGASRGIGKGLAIGLAELGATVVCAARSLDASVEGIGGTVRDTAQAINDAGGTALALQCDIGDEDDIARL